MSPQMDCFPPREVDAVDLGQVDETRAARLESAGAQLVDEVALCVHSVDDESNDSTGCSLVEQETGLTTTNFQPYHSQSVPKSENLGAHAREGSADENPVTTMMLRNIPNKYSQSTLIQEINDAGFLDTYDFFYLPMDVHNRSNVGYAFINFQNSDDAEHFRVAFSDHNFQRFHSRKIGSVCAAHVQGLDANLHHFANRAVTQARNDQYRPVVLQGRTRIDFDEAVASAKQRMPMQELFAAKQVSQPIPLPLRKGQQSQKQLKQQHKQQLHQQRQLQQRQQGEQQDEQDHQHHESQQRRRRRHPHVHEKQEQHAQESEIQREVVNKTPKVEGCGNFGDDTVAQGREGLEAIIRRYLATTAPIAGVVNKVPPPPGLDLESSANDRKHHRPSSNVSSLQSHAKHGANVAELLCLRSRLVEKLYDQCARNENVEAVETDAVNVAPFPPTPSLRMSPAYVSTRETFRDAYTDNCRTAVPGTSAFEGFDMHWIVPEGSLISAA